MMMMMQIKVSQFVDEFKCVSIWCEIYGLKWINSGYTRNNKCQWSKQSILIYEIESSVHFSFYLCARAMCKMNLAFRCEKNVRKFEGKKMRKKWEECLPEIYITINKWRKSNFTLSFAPISSTCFFLHSCCTSRVVIEFQEYWCVFCMDCAVCIALRFTQTQT